MSNDNSKLADAVRLIERMGENHPLLSYACAAMGYSVEELLLQVHPVQTVGANDDFLMKIAGNIDDGAPLLSKQKRWEFLVTYLSDYQFSDKISQKLIADIAKHPALEIELCQTTNQSKPLAPLNNYVEFWRRASGWLNDKSSSHHIDEVKLSHTMAQLQPLEHLPLKKRFRKDIQTWLYIDHSEENYPLYLDFAEFTEQLCRHLGLSEVSKVVEITNMCGRISWRIAQKNVLELPIQNSPLPLPDANQQAIIIGDPKSFTNKRWQNWLQVLRVNSRRLICIGTRAVQGWYYWGKASDIIENDHNNVERDSEATELLLALLSTTPARLTTAMVRDLRQQITGGSIGIERDLFDNNQLQWSRYTGNGYWPNPDERYHEMFKRLAAEQQCLASDIIVRHLPLGTKSLRYEHLLFAADLSETWRELHQQELIEAEQFFAELASLLYANIDQPQKVNKAVGYVYSMARRMGVIAERLPQPIQSAITLANYQISEHMVQANLSLGINQHLFGKLKNQKSAKKVEGGLYHTGRYWQLSAVTDKKPSPATLIVKLGDISQLLLNHAGQNLNAPAHVIHSPLVTGVHRGQTSCEAFTLQTKTSDYFYWAESLSVSANGVVAEVDGIRINWPSDGQLQRATIELLPEAASWLHQFPPKLDKYGLYVELVGLDISCRFRYIPSGSFLMGSPPDEVGRYDNETQHCVTLTKGFWLSDTPVTQQLWKTVMSANPSYFKAAEGIELPVEGLSWKHCQSFCQLLTSQFSGLNFTLPTEAQWEYACRAGTQTAFNTGSLLSVAQANFNVNRSYMNEKKGRFRGHTIGVYQLPPNKWGLYQMHGNVWEWCQDSQREFQSEWVVDPIGSSDHGQRVLRGNCWSDIAGNCRSANRLDANFDIPYAFAGLRLVLSGQGSELMSITQLDIGENDKTQLGTALDIDLLDLAERDRRSRWQYRPPVVFPSQWASEWGFDCYGLWQTFIVNEIKCQLRFIPHGQFMMGSKENEENREPLSLNETLHLVTLSKGFWLGSTTVSQQLWQAIMGSNPSTVLESEDLTLPVNKVSWDDCLLFCEKVNQLVPGLKLTLPSEAQWEYACRAGNQAAFSTGKQLALEDANFDSNQPNFNKYIVSVDKFRPNNWGLYQMHGNVWEWCLDAPREFQTESEINPIGDVADKPYRVLRGGSWDTEVSFCRSASRFHFERGIRVGNIGLRVAVVEVQQAVLPLHTDLDYLQKNENIESQSSLAEIIDAQEKQIDLSLKSAVMGILKELISDNLRHDDNPEKLLLVFINVGIVADSISAISEYDLSKIEKLLFTYSSVIDHKQLLALFINKLKVTFFNDLPNFDESPEEQITEVRSNLEGEGHDEISQLILQWNGESNSNNKRVRKRYNAAEVLEKVANQKNSIYSDLRKGNTNRAEQKLKDLIEFHYQTGEPKHLCRSLCDLGSRIIQKTDDYKLALSVFNYARQADAFDQMAMLGFAETLRLMGRLDEALIEYKAAKEKFNESPVVANCLAETLRSLGLLDEALVEYKEAREKFNDNPVAVTGLAEVLLEMGRYDEALVEYIKAKEKFVNDAVVATGLAETLRAMGRYDEALVEYIKAKEKYVDNLVVATGLAATLRAMGRYDEALVEYIKAKEKFVNSPVVATGLAATLRAMGRYDEALVEYQLARDRFPTDVECVIGYAETLRSMKRFEEAIVQYQKALVKFGDLPAIVTGFEETWQLWKEFDKESGFDITDIYPRIQAEMVHAAPNKFSERQREISRLLGLGHSDKGIASQLNISHNTVSNHLKTIYGILKVNNRTDAITILSKQKQRNVDNNPINLLTQSEINVVNLLIQALSTKEIASKLNVQYKTIANQMQSIYRKLEVSNRSEAIYTLYYYSKLPSTQVFNLPDETKDSSIVGQLSARQRQICKYMIKGFTSKEIAEYLSNDVGNKVDFKTVDSHIQSIFKTLKVRTRAAATAYLMRTGFF